MVWMMDLPYWITSHVIHKELWKNERYLNCTENWEGLTRIFNFVAGKKNEFNLPAPFLNQFQRELNHLIYNLLQSLLLPFTLLIYTWFLENQKSSWMNLIFCLFRTWILQAIQAVNQIDKKSSSSNLIFQTRFFKNQV